MAEEKKRAVICLGPSGYGKSSVVNALLGKEVAKVSDQRFGCTRIPADYENGNHVVIDTPGTGDTAEDPSQKLTDEDIYRMTLEIMAKYKIICLIICVDDAYCKSPRGDARVDEFIRMLKVRFLNLPAVVLFNVRARGVPRKTPQNIQEVFEDIRDTPGIDFEKLITEFHQLGLNVDLKTGQGNAAVSPNHNFSTLVAKVKKHTDNSTVLALTTVSGFGIKCTSCGLLVDPLFLEKENCLYHPKTPSKHAGGFLASHSLSQISKVHRRNSTNKNGEYKCCGKKDACYLKYDCCSIDKFTSGCTSYCLFCNRPASSDGCLAQCDNCGKAKEPGCMAKKHSFQQ